MATRMPILHLAKTGAPQKGGPFIGINTINWMCCGLVVRATQL